MNKELEKQFDDEFTTEGGQMVGGIMWDSNGLNVRNVKQFINENYISKKQLIKEINNIKDQVRKETGAFKYDFCFELIEDLCKD